MGLMATLRYVIYCILAGMALQSCYPPPMPYAHTKLVSERRSKLSANLLQLLPPKEQQRADARQEARWLADTAYKAAAAISRINSSYFPGWAGNALVNARMQDRGLCWHYQHDMFRELRRRPLKYFRLGCCVRDHSRRTEHNCLYIAARHGKWPHVWVLDAWMWNGRLKVDAGTALSQKRWADLPRVATTLTEAYPEGHRVPIEHWLVLRGFNGKYDYFNAETVVGSPQHRRMSENVRKGYREHPGNPVNY